MKEFAIIKTFSILKEDREAGRAITLLQCTEGFKEKGISCQAKKRGFKGSRELYGTLNAPQNRQAGRINVRIVKVHLHRESKTCNWKQKAFSHLTFSSLVVVNLYLFFFLVQFLQTQEEELCCGHLSGMWDNYMMHVDAGYSSPR